MDGYQTLKLLLLETVPLSRDGFHIYIGFAVFAITLLCLRRPLRSFSLLLPGLVVAVLLEILDAKHDLATLGHVQWVASLLDVLNTNLIPFAIVLLARFERLCAGEKKKPVRRT